MKQIGNWVFGSFFRTIGRLLVFVLLGIIIAHFVDFGSLIDNFRITDLFFEKVNASTLTSNANYNSSSYLNITNASDFTTSWDYFKKAINSTTDGSIQEIQYRFDNWNTTSYDFIEFPFSLSQPIQVNTSNTTTSTITHQSYCDKWTWAAVDSYNNVTQWRCSSYNFGVDDDTITDKEYIEYNSSLTNFNMIIRVGFSDNSFSYCNVENNFIVCPTNKRNINDLTIQFNFQTAKVQTAYFALFRSSNNYIKDKTNQDIINSQNSNSQQQMQQQEQQHNEIMDTNMTETNETATSFFDSFESDDIGGLSGIVTAPLNMINKMLDGTCTSPSATWKGATISLPCGDMFWNRPGAGDIKQLLNIFYGGFLCYYAIRKLFLMVENLKDPTQDRIEVSDL